MREMATVVEPGQHLKQFTPRAAARKYEAVAAAITAAAQPTQLAATTAIRRPTV